MTTPPEDLAWRVHPAPAGPTLVYLPGLHGDWTLVGGFREALDGRATFIELCYPRTLDWTLADHARAVAERLARSGQGPGWLLAESFGSQVAWAWLADPTLPWQPRGVVFAGGFVRYSPRWLLRLSESLLCRVRVSSLQAPLRLYVHLVQRLRYRGGPRPPDLEEFLQRRTEADKHAAAHRLRLIAGSDWRAVARTVRRPIYHLTGFWDPIVPWWPVHRWLRRHCPAFRGARILARSDHHVLGCAPRLAAEQVLEWMALAEAPPSPAVA